jgi:four helix bundle protein
MTKITIQEKSYSFALRVIALYRVMVAHNEFVLSKQVLKSGTSIGANIEEAQAGQSRADFLSKMSIASKEARETRYWLRLIRDSKILGTRDVAPLLEESDELVRIISSIVKTTATSK